MHFIISFLVHLFASTFSGKSQPRRMVTSLLRNPCAMDVKDGSGKSSKISDNSGYLLK